MNNNKLVVYKSNHLVNASYKLNLNEQRIILLAISKMNSQNTKQSKTITIKADEFCERYNINKNDFYNAINESLNSLYNRTLKIRDEEKKGEFRFISSKFYYQNSSNFEITFSDEIMPYLIDLKNNFTKYNLNNIKDFKNKYTIRFFELFNEFKYKTIKKRIIKISELRECLQLTNEYTRFNSLRENVIDKALSELHKYTNIQVKYKKIFEKKAVFALEFEFSFDSEQKIEENKVVSSKPKKFAKKQIRKATNINANIQL